jgi:hypothetical protein
MGGEGAVRRIGVGVSRRITTATTTVVKTGAGILYRIIVGATAAGVITVYDALSGVSGKEIVKLKASISEGSYAIGAVFQTGLTIITEAASDITVIYE